MQLPINLTDSLQQTRWKSILDPVIDVCYQTQSNVEHLQDLPLNNMVVLDNITLAVGANTITHNLGRVPVGWIIMDINASATVYRSAAFNISTLTLTSSAIATIKLGVF
jgi:hypothetical protein